MGDILSDVETFEERLSLPKGFYDNLLKEDDWSFVIKLSALFEAACTQTLVVKLGSPDIEDCFTHLEQSNSKYGKILFLKKLGAIYPVQAKFLEKLAELRNQLAHNISNAAFEFKSHIEGMNENQKKIFIKWVGHGIHPKVEYKGTVITREDFVVSHPKISLWLTSAEVLACMHLEIDHSESTQNLGISRWLTDKDMSRLPRYITLCTPGMGLN